MEVGTADDYFFICLKYVFWIFPTEFIVPFALISVAVYYVFHNILIAMVVGIVTGMSSAGPLTRLLSDTGLNKTEEGNKIFQQVVTIEIAAVILFSFFADLHNKPIDFISVFTIALELFVSLLLIILFSKYYERHSKLQQK